MSTGLIFSVITFNAWVVNISDLQFVGVKERGVFSIMITVTN